MRQTGVDGSQATDARRFSRGAYGLAGGHLARRVRRPCGMRRATAKQGQRHVRRWKWRDSGGVGHYHAWRAAAARSTWSVPCPTRRRGAGADRPREDPLCEFRRGADVQHHLGRADSFDKPGLPSREGIVVVEFGARHQGGPYGAGAPARRERPSGMAIRDHLHSMSQSTPPSCTSLRFSYDGLFRVYSFLLLATTRL